MDISQDAIENDLAYFIKQAALEPFFNASQIRQAAATAARAVPQWPSEMALALPDVLVDWKIFSFTISHLALYDLHMLVDQDETMRSSTRWRHLRIQVQETAKLILPFAVSSKVTLHACNATAVAASSSAANVPGWFDTLDFNNILPVGQALKQKVLSSILGGNNVLQRPCLVYIFTTGEARGGTMTGLVQYVQEIKNTLKDLGYGSAALAIEIIQIGQNYGARQFLGQLESLYGPDNFLDVSSETRIEERYRRDQGWLPATSAVLAVRNLAGAVEPRFLQSRKPIDDFSLYQIATEKDLYASYLQRKLQEKNEIMQKELRDKLQRDSQAEIKRITDTSEKAAQQARATADSQVNNIRSQLVAETTKYNQYYKYYYDEVSAHNQTKNSLRAESDSHNSTRASLNTANNNLANTQAELRNFKGYTSQWKGTAWGFHDRLNRSTDGYYVILREENNAIAWENYNKYK